MCWCFLRCDIMDSWLSGLTFYKLSEVTICIDFYGVFFLFLALSRSRGLFKRIKFVVWLFTNMKEIQNWKLNRVNVWIPATPWIFIIIFFQKSISLVFFFGFSFITWTLLCDVAVAGFGVCSSIISYHQICVTNDNFLRCFCF